MNTPTIPGNSGSSSALEAGSVQKHVAFEQFLVQLEGVLPQVLSRCLGEFNEPPASDLVQRIVMGTKEGMELGFNPLNDKEVAFLDLSARGIARAKIAGTIDYSEKHCGRIAKSVKEKLHADSMPQAAYVGFKRGILAYPCRPEFVVDPGLTPRERECLGLLIEGKSNSQMGEQLHLSGRTIESHMRIVKRRLAARNRTHIVRRALALGVLE